MKKNLVLILCIVSILATCLASCQKECEHTFSEEWMSDKDNHWHPATCDHAETERKDFGPHADENEDGFCDICEDELGHEHTFVNEWTITETHHWKASSCSHADEKSQYNLHVDEDKNGECDVCTGHVHDVNGAGYCKIESCGKKVKEIDETSLEELVNAIYTQKHLVNGGKVDYRFNGQSNTGPDFAVTRREEVDYVFGTNDYTYVKVLTDVVNGGVSANELRESWHHSSGPETAFGVISINGAPLTLDLAESVKLNGYLVELSTLVGEYGIEDTLYTLYSIAIGDVEAEEGVTTNTKDLVTIPNADENKVTFKYSYTHARINPNRVAVGDANTPEGSIIYNVNLFEVEVTFCYTDDYALTSLDIKVDCYTNDPGTADSIGFLYNDVDIAYDPDTQEITFIEYNKDENGNWVATPTDKRTPDVYTISVTQEVGARTEENPNPKEKFVPTGFDLYLNRDEDTGELSNKFDGSVLKVNVGDILNFYVDNCYPAGTSLHFAQDQVSLKIFKNNVEVADPTAYTNQVAVAMFTLSGERRSFFMIPKEDGAYRFEIYVMNNKVYDISIHAGVVDEEHIDLKDNEFAAKVTETYSWSSNEVVFTATEAGTYYFNLPECVGMIDADAVDAANETEATDDGPAPYFDYNNAKNEDGTYNAGSFHIYLEAGESIRFYVNAMKRGTYVISFFSIS